MKTYNQIMRYFWLSASVIILIVTTFMSFKEGFNKWGYYYIFVLTTLGVYFLKTWMMKRMEKHTAFLKDKK